MLMFSSIRVAYRRMIRNTSIRRMSTGRAIARGAIRMTSPRTKARCRRSWRNTTSRVECPTTRWRRGIAAIKPTRWETLPKDRSVRTFASCKLDGRWLAARLSAFAQNFQREWPGSVTHQREGNRGKGEREFVSMVTQQTVPPVNFPDRDHHVDEDGQRRPTREQSQQDQNAAEKFCQRRRNGEESRQTQALHAMPVLHKSAAEDFVITVADHDGAQHDPQHQQGNRLQTIEVAQARPPKEFKNIRSECRRNQRESRTKNGESRTFPENS